MEQVERPKKRGNPRIAEYGALSHWKPGTSGNPKGRTPAKLITDALRGIYEDPKQLEKFVLAAHRRAIKGHAKFWELIADRLEGKVLQQVELTGNIVHEITEVEKSMAQGSISKIKALQSEAENPILAEGVETP